MYTFAVTVDLSFIAQFSAEIYRGRMGGIFAFILGQFSTE